MNKLIIILLSFFFTFNYLLAINLDKNTYINTKNITYDKNKNLIELGNDSLININDINILTDKGTVDYNNNSLIINGDFYLYQNENVLSGENLTGNINLTNFKADNISYIYNNDLKIDAKKIQRIDNIITFNESFVTPCELDGFFGCPTWSIKVPKTKYNISDDKFEHYDLFLQIADNKILYTPYLSHYGSKAGRKKGFLYPGISIDFIKKNSFITLPYYLPVNVSSDIIFTPSFSITDKPGIDRYKHNIQYNNKSTGGDTSFQIFNEFNENFKEPFSLLKLNTNQTINKNMNFSLSLVNTNNISKTRSNNKNPIPFDNLFLKVENYNFFKKNDLFISKLSSVTSYSDGNNTLIPVELPSIYYSNTYQINKNISGFNDFKLSYIVRDRSSSTLPSENKKISINTTLFDDKNFRNSLIFNKLDYFLNYSLSNFSHNSDLNKEQINSYVIISSEIRKPIIRPTDARLKFIIYNNLVKDNFIINESSNSHTFNYQNMFAEKRIFGSDLIDNSSRVIYGLENKFLINKTNISINFAQSYDFKLNSNYLNNIKQTEKFSDISFETKIKLRNFEFKFDSRNNNKTLSKKELNYSLSLLKPVNLNLAYNETEKDAYSNLTNDSKSLTFSTSKNLNENLIIGFSSNLDLKEDYKPYQQSMNLTFFDECSSLNITYINTRYNDNFNTKPTETIRFEFYMDYLGLIGYEQSTDLLNNNKTENYYSSGIF